MIMGYILLGILAAFVGAGTALGLGASLWAAFGIYTLCGCAGTAAIPIGRGIMQVLSSRPLSPAHDIQPTPLPQAATPVRSNVFTILAVDAAPFILDLVSTTAASAGRIDIVTASSAAQALALLEDDTRTFDYLLYDIGMPQMSGIAFCQAVRKMDNYRHVPLVMLTARHNMHNIAAAFRAGATNYVIKPFHIENLRLQIQKALATFMAQTDPDASISAPPRAQANTLCDAESLSACLTLLPAPDAAKTRIVAIKIDRLETLRSCYTPDHMTILRDKITATVASNLAAGHTLMAWTPDNTLIVATTAADMLNVTRLEHLISADLQAGDPLEANHDPQRSGISITPPLPLLGTRSRRAELAIARAIASAADISMARNVTTLRHLQQAINA